VQKALPLLVDGASVILAGSTASIVGMPAFSVYGASKAALRSFARNWTLDLKARRIRVNVLSPGPTKTPGLLGLASDDRAAQQAMLGQMASELPIGRVADPDEIAGAALFLASDASSFVTSAELLSMAARRKFACRRGSRWTSRSNRRVTGARRDVRTIDHGDKR
jgi:NAD(P)-dependent dehydrogenase (short-subunit alcohol dehydrogenase family)